MDEDIEIEIHILSRKSAYQTLDNIAKLKFISKEYAEIEYKTRDQLRRSEEFLKSKGFTFQGPEIYNSNGDKV